MSKTFSYPRSIVVKEYCQTGIGIVFTGVPLLLFGPSSVIVSLLGCFFCLFLAYGIRAYRHSQMKFIVDNSAIQALGPGKKVMLWEELEEIKLSYFSTRRDGENGWMQLKLKGRGKRLRVESTITDFWDLVGICALKAKNRGLALDPSTIQNMHALGIEDDVSGYQHVHDWGKNS